MIYARPERDVEGRLSAAASPELTGTLHVPLGAAGLVLLVQARGSSRLGLLSRGIAPMLRTAQFATCVTDLLDSSESHDRLKLHDVDSLAWFKKGLEKVSGFEKVSGTVVRSTLRAVPATVPDTFLNHDFLTDRLASVVDYLAADPATGHLPLAIVGRDSTASAAIAVAAERSRRVKAVVACCGRPDRVQLDLAKYQVPTLLLVPGSDLELAEANERFFLKLRCESQLAVIREGSRLAEPATLAASQKLIRSWCARYVRQAGRLPPWGSAHCGRSPLAAAAMGE